MVLNSIIERHNKLTPLSETEIKIIEAASRLFLKQGFSVSTLRQIAQESGFGLGTVTYHYRTKEDMLRILVEELMDYHLDILENTVERKEDRLFAYAVEVAIQMALCENDKKAWDLYHAAYTHPPTYNYIKDWAARKNYQLLSDKTPDLHESDYYEDWEEDDDYCDGCCDDCDEDCGDEFYDVTCPSCDTTFCVDEETLLEGGIECPNCGENLEFEIEEEDEDEE